MGKSKSAKDKEIVTILDKHDDGVKMRSLILAGVIFILFPALIHSGEVEFTYMNSWDSTEQKAVAYIPEANQAQNARPLLVVAHYMGGNRYTARRQGYYEECEKRNWLLLCPELHGKRTSGESSLAAPEAQHDVMDAISYMQKRYHVDTSRIYVAGRSMGGMLGQILGAKYPDIFAAVVAGQGVSDLKLWFDTTVPHLREIAIDEMQPYSPETAFDYQRRSSVNFARNFRYVPLILWHGTNDTWVPPEQSEKLYEEIRMNNPYQEPVKWLVGAAHAPQNYTVQWVCNQFEFYQNRCELGMKLPHRFFSTLDLVTDEAKWFFWLFIRPRNDQAFARAKVSLQDQTITVETGNVSELSIDLDLIPGVFVFTRYRIESAEQPIIILQRGNRTVERVGSGAERTGILHSGGE